MVRRAIAGGLAVVLAAGTFFCGMGGQISQAEENAGTASGSAVVVPQPLPEMAASSVLSVKKDKSLKKVTVTWNAVNDAHGYYIMRKLNKGVYQNIASVQGAVVYVDTSVQAGKTYSYQVVPWQAEEGQEPRVGSCLNEKSVSLVPAKEIGRAHV